MTTTRVPRTGLALLALCLSVAVVSCRPRNVVLPNVVLVVVDTLRADRLGSYGHSPVLTPFLDGLAAQGLRVEQGYASSSWTMPSIASLFTSRYPSQHQVNDLEMKLAEDETTLAERLSRAGYLSGGFTANWRLRSENGFAQGFSHFQPIFPDIEKSGKTRGEAVFSNVTAWLDAASAAAPERPLFLYLHYMEPHAPMEPPADLRERFAPGFSDGEVAAANELSLSMSPAPSKGLSREQGVMLASLYEAEVAAVDRAIEKMFAELKRRGLLEGALVIVTADHGEEFLEHGAIGHGTNLFNETARVPLIFAGPIVAPGVLRRPMSLIDVAPTILDVAGLPSEPRFEGVSRAEWLTEKSVRETSGTEANAADVLLQLPRDTSPNDVRLHESGFVSGSSKLLVSPDGSTKMYDLGADPEELAPLDSPELRAKLALRLQDMTVALGSRGRPSGERIEIDPAIREKLKALGYHQ